MIPDYRSGTTAVGCVGMNLKNQTAGWSAQRNEHRTEPGYRTQFWFVNIDVDISSKTLHDPQSYFQPCYTERLYSRQ